LPLEFRRQINACKIAGKEIDLDPFQASRDWYINPQLREKHEDVGITEEDLAAMTFLRMRKEVETLERMIASAESRRNKIFRQLENHRDRATHRARQLSPPSDGVAKTSTPTPQSWTPETDPLKEVLDAFRARISRKNSSD
jgi:hypothetical protein